MWLLSVMRAWMYLFAYDIVTLVSRRPPHGFVRRCPVSGAEVSPERAALISLAVREAIVWYFKHVYCLQKACVTVYLLRQHGVPAELVIGYEPISLAAHAWVEVRGVVVNDVLEVKVDYVVLDRP